MRLRQQNKGTLRDAPARGREPGREHCQTLLWQYLYLAATAWGSTGQSARSFCQQTREVLIFWFFFIKEKERRASCRSQHPKPTSKASCRSQHPKPTSKASNRSPHPKHPTGPHIHKPTSHSLQISPVHYNFSGNGSIRAIFSRKQALEALLTYCVGRFVHYVRNARARPAARFPATAN